MNASKRNLIFQRFKEHNPEPKTELKYNNTFELLIAVILSAQATDQSVNKATEMLFQVANTPEKMLALDEQKLKSFIKRIGLFNTKSKNILKTCQMLVRSHHSTVPNQRELLESLPGVGRKTANVILNTAFGQETIAVDTHIFRVANRTKIATGKTPLAVENKLQKVIPKMFKKNAHHWLVLHGRYICIARKPKCRTCFINDLCEYELKNN